VQETFTVKIGPAGQTTIPQSLLDLFDIREGDELLVVATPTRVVNVIPQRLSLFSPEVVTLLNESEKRIDEGEYHEGMVDFRAVNSAKASAAGAESE